MHEFGEKSFSLRMLFNRRRPLMRDRGNRVPCPRVIGHASDIGSGTWRRAMEDLVFDTPVKVRLRKGAKIRQIGSTHEAGILAERGAE
ncbi:hypothetical protein ASD12_24835 [Mesorhizobium sp. Root102]|nr:hypothetical protein ASD12_24835 [Mesorhizobium sp. Root102]